MEQYTLLFSIKWWGVLGGVIIHFIVGMLWYGPFFGKRWMQEVGMDEEQIRQGPVVGIYLATLLFSVIATLTLAITLNGFATTSIAQACAVAGMVWFGFNFVQAFNHNNFENKSIKLLMINSCFDLTVFVLVAILLQISR